MSFSPARLIVVTDLDGTLLNLWDGSFQEAQPALNRLRMLQIPWVINSNKTLAELKTLRETLVNPYPLILENGSGIALPKGFEDAFFNRPDEEYLEYGDFLLKPMGMPRDQLLELLEPAYQSFDFTGFAKMKACELSKILGTTEDRAENALNRNFDEPIVWHDSEEAFIEFQHWGKSVGLHVSSSYKFAHVTANADKGASMDWLLSCFSDDGTKPRVIALGDGPSDIPMLRSADVAVIVRSSRHEPLDVQGRERTLVTDDCGPAGWNTAVLDLLDRYYE